MSEKVVGWQKLNHKCEVCHKEHSDISFTFADRLGQRVEYYHWECLPPVLKAIQLDTEQEMIAIAMTPPGG